MLLYQVTAKHFCAGIIVSNEGVCMSAAPILKWAVGRRRDFLRSYFRSRGWIVTYCKTLDK